MSTFKTNLRRGFLTMQALVAFAGIIAAQTPSGEWTLSPSDVPGRVRFSLEGSRSEAHHFSTSSDWNANEFQGLDWSTAGKHDVKFVIVRDAGRFECEGFLKNGEGAGLFTFQPNQRYRSDMEALDLPGVTDERVIAFALHDVSVAFARDMKSVGIQGLDADKLMAFRIHGVTREFVAELHSAGLTETEADKLIAFRIHGVSPEFVRDLQRLGYSHPAPDQLIALRIHGVTPEYIEKLRSHGMQNLTLQQLVSLRIHGID